MHQQPPTVGNLKPYTLHRTPYTCFYGGRDEENNSGSNCCPGPASGIRHAIQANYTAGSTMTVAGKIFELKQFQFHSPSEKQINGESFPMEVHFVHADTDCNLAVISVSKVHHRR